MLNQNAPHVLKSCLLLLALMGVFVKAMIPMGFMPDFLGKTGNAIVICSSFGEKTIYVDDHGAPLDSKHHVKTPCEFSSIPALIAIVGDVSLLLLVLAQISILIFSRIIYARPYAHAPPITGPPANLLI